MAAHSGFLEVVKILVEHGAKVDAVDKIQRTPLHRAARFGREKVIELVLKNGADKTLKDMKGQTPLDLVKDESGILMVRINYLE